MTNERLAELRAIESRATPGPWEVWTSNSLRRITAHGKQDGGVLSAIMARDGVPDLHCHETDLAFIAASRSALPELLDEVERWHAIAERDHGAPIETVEKLRDQLAAAQKEIERLRSNRDHSCACSVNDGGAPLVKHDKDCPIRVNARKRISPEVALDRIAAAIDSGDENDTLRRLLAEALDWATPCDRRHDRQDGYSSELLPMFTRIGDRMRDDRIAAIRREACLGETGEK